MTETSTTVAVMTPDQKLFTLGSAGKLMPGVTARVLKSDGSFGGFNEIGELVVASPSNALRYENNAEAYVSISLAVKSSEKASTERKKPS
jgi:4-coumarate--CoA ligase